MQKSASERLRQSGDHLLVPATQMSELRERTVEMPLADAIGTRVERRDHGRGLARRALPNEKRGSQPAGFFAVSDDLGRYGHLASQIVDAPVPQTIEVAGVRCDAPRHGDIDDDETTARDTRSQEIGGEERAARVGRRYDAIGRVHRAGDVFKRDGLTIGDRGHLLRALTRAADDEDASDTAAEGA